MVSLFLFDPAGTSLNLVRLCIVTPTAGGRVLEAGGEKILLLADQNQSAFSTTFFLYCALIHLEFLISSSCYRIHSIRPTGEDEESRVETRERTYEPNSTIWKEWGRSPENIWYLCAVSPTYDKSPQDPTATLRQSFRYIHTILIYVIDRSLVRPNYQEDVSALVENTRDIVKQRLQGDAWIMWAIAQRASLPVKIEACITYALLHLLRL